MMVEGTERDYCGEAINPKHLSLFEVMLGYGRRYCEAARLRNPTPARLQR